MKIIKAVILSVVLYAASGLSYAAGPIQGSGSTASSGKGGTGVSSSGGDYFILNPAAISGEERFFFSTGYGSLDSDFIFSDSVFVYPTSYGVFGGNLRYLSGYDSEDDVNSYAFSLGMGKGITSRFAFGLGIKGMYLDYGKGDYFSGLTTGLHYKFKGTVKASGFGFFDPVAGLASDLGYYSTKGTDLNSINAGYSFGFYKNDYTMLRFNNDFSAVNRFRDFPVKLGLESHLFNRFVIRGGAVFPDYYDYMTWTAGAGYIISGSNYNASVDYSFTWSGKNGASHFAGVSVSYGALDIDPPETSIKPDLNYISPNYDGRQDYVIFDTEVKDQSPVKGWRLQIFNEKDLVVREFRVSERDIEERLTAGSFFARLFSRKESMIVPSGILWDGSDGRGSVFPDGRYKYYFYAWDMRENISPVKSGTVVIDTVSPEVTLLPGSYIFSPNNDGNLDNLVIAQNIKTAPDDVWTAVIRDYSGKEIVSYKWPGNRVPSEFIWDGMDSNGDPAVDGLYFYSIASEDRAGNKAFSEVREITLTTRMEIADVRLSEEFISYKSGRKNQLRMFPDLSDRKGLERWEIEIAHSSGETVKKISGGGSIPAFVDWNCLDGNGNELEDGSFFVTFRAWFISGNNPESYAKKIVFDSTPPAVALSHEPELFSPDDDGENDLLVIKIKASDNTGISSWTLKIINENNRIFKTFSGMGTPPEEIIWDGTGDSREPVESASDYFMEITASDMAGNVSEKVRAKFAVDVLVVVTERGLKMRISNIEFAFGSAALGTRGEKILDRVAVILEKYGRYNVVIEGHTDDIGNDDYNRKLSEKRAISVRDYLIKKGIEPARMKYEGLGESMPFYPNTNDENRKRNRRVEFLLLKEKE